MNILASRTFAATAAAVIATMVARLGIAAGSSGGGDHAALTSLEQKVHALNRQVKDVSQEAHHEFHESGELVKVLQSIIEKGRPAHTPLREPNVVKAVATKALPKGGAVTVDALCPADRQVISGGYLQGAENGEVTRAVPIQRPKPGYEVSVFEQPGLANGNQDTTVTAVAYCAPIATAHAGEAPKAVVFGSDQSCQRNDGSRQQPKPPGLGDPMTRSGAQARSGTGRSVRQSTPTTGATPTLPLVEEIRHLVRCRGRVSEVL